MALLLGGVPTVSELVHRPARPQTQPTSAWWGIRAGEVIYPGYPGCACPTVVIGAHACCGRCGGIGRTHDTSPRRGRTYGHLSCHLPRPRGAGVDIQARRHAGQRIRNGRICGGRSATYCLPPCWRSTAAASSASNLSALANGVSPSLVFAFTAAPFSSSKVAVSTALPLVA